MKWNVYHKGSKVASYPTFDDASYTITAVGSEAPVTLAGLGHCTMNFSGQTTVELPGTIYIENKPLPEIKVGTVIQILAD